MGHLVTQFQGQILRAAANNRVCGPDMPRGAAMPRLPLLIYAAECQRLRRENYISKALTPNQNYSNQFQARSIEIAALCRSMLL